MNKIEYILLKLQTSYFDRYFRDIYSCEEKREDQEESILKVRKEIPLLAEKYNISVEMIKDYFENKHKKEFNEENVIKIYFDKLYLNKKYAYLLEIKNLLPSNVKKDISEAKQEKYKNIIDMYMEKKLNYSCDGFYVLRVPLRYFEKKELEFLSQYKLLSRAGMELTLTDKYTDLLLKRKFEQFNIICQKFKDIEFDDLSRMLFLVSYHLNKSGVDLDEYIETWKKECFSENESLFKKIEELNYSHKHIIEKTVQGFSKSNYFSFLPIRGNKYNEQDLNNVYSFIHRYLVIDEKMALKAVVEKNLTEEKITPNKKRI